MKWIEIGKISRPHGFRGEFVVLTESGDASSLRNLKEIWIGPTSEQKTAYSVLEAAWMPRGWKMKVSGIQSDEEVKKLIGHKIFADRACLPPSAENEYYIVDLIGAEVRDCETGEPVGKLGGVEPGSQDRWWITTGDRQIVIPATKHFVNQVDVEARVIWVRNWKELK